MVTNRKGKSPREVLSLFDDMSRRKEQGELSTSDDMSIFDVIADQGKSSSKEMAGEPQPDYACSQTQPQQQRKSLNPAYRVPSWKAAEFEHLKQDEADTPAKNSDCRTSHQQTKQQGKNELSTPVVAGSKKKKTIRLFVLVLLVVFIFVLIQITLGPPIRGLGGDKFIVQGILYSQDAPSAIVNGRIMRKGDVISGVTVVEINKHSVEFEENESASKEARRFTKKVEL